MNKKLNAKDFILIGVLTALMWIICMIISTVMSIAGPVTNVFYPAVVAIPNGIVMMLLLAKVPKKGVFTICGTIQGILFLLVGGFWLIPVALIVGGVICDFLIMERKEITMKSMMIAYTIFSGIFAFGAIVGPMSFLQDAFVGAMEKNNIAQEYIDPLATIEYILIPLLMRCLKVTDELAASGTTRGLELEGKRYALNPVRFSWKEYAVTALGIVFLALLLFLDHTSIGEIIIWRV